VPELVWVHRPTLKPSLVLRRSDCSVPSCFAVTPSPRTVWQRADLPDSASRSSIGDKVLQDGEMRMQTTRIETEYVMTYLAPLDLPIAVDGSLQI
jgi:hypothetical protein